MKFNHSGTAQLDIPMDSAFAFLSDPKNLAQCVPDMEEFSIKDKDNFTVKVKVGVSFIRGEMTLAAMITESVPPQSLKFHVEGNDFGTGVKLDVSLRLAKASAASTSMAWTADSELSGVATGIGEQLLRKISESNIQQILKNLKVKAEAAYKK